MQFTVIGLVLAAALFRAAPAHAFSIEDHREITRRAFQEWQSCGHLLPPPVVAWIDEANADEDLNLIRKWTHYSHYFNPFKKLNMSRADSSATVDESVASLSSSGLSLQEKSYLLGRIIHHLQDAAVPAHVVPVSHWITDGFESLKVLWPKLEPDCDAVKQVEARAMDPHAVLVSQAIETWNSLDGTFGPESGIESARTWRGNFWSAGAGSDFGSYGTFGNHFGESRIQTTQGEVRINMATYRAYKLGQLLEAVRSTQAAWAWLNRNPAILTDVR